MTRPPDIKILLIGDFPPPHGGVATHVEELFRAVRARSGSCEVLDIGKGQLPADGVTPAGGIARFSASLAWFAARGYRIHLHTSGANPRSWMLASVCAAAGRASGRPAMITLHSGLGPAWLTQKLTRLAIARGVLHQFGTVIVVSEEIHRVLEVPGALVVPAFSHEFLQPGTAPEGLADLRAEASPLFCAMVAPRPEYGEAILLRAFEQVRAKLSSARLALYGAGTEQFAGQKPVLGFGELSRPQALSVIATSDVFVRPTLADGDSVSVREALALGRTVVATRVGHRPEEVRLVEPGDAAALAAGMIEAAGAAPVRAARPEADGVQRVLTLYGFPPPAVNEQATAVSEEAAPCAASAAS